MNLALPPTERILGRLPGPRLPWVMLWASVPLVAALVPGAYVARLGEVPLPLRLATGAAFAYAVGLSIWAAGWFARQARTVDASLDPHDGTVFVGVDNVAAPLGLALLFTGLTAWGTVTRGGVALGIGWAPIAFVVNLALMTAVWMYLCLLLGLKRLGRRRISLASFPQDPSLGLGEAGRLAFTAFAFYAAGFVPVLAVNAGGALWLGTTLGLFVLGVLAFFASLEGLHRQLLAARRHHLESARRLYAEAYEPVRSGSIEALSQRAELLLAADAIERRAQSIQRWPFEDRRLRQILAIAGTMITFVTTGVVTQLVTRGLGL